MTEEGYLQNKIREIQDKTSKIEMDSYKLHNEVFNFIKKIEDKDKVINSTLEKANFLLNQIDSEDLKNKVENMVRVSIEKDIKQVNKNIEKISEDIKVSFKEREETFRQELSQRIQNVEIEIGNKFSDNLINFSKNLVSKVFDIMQHVLEKNKLSKPMPMILATRRFYNNEDVIFTLDFEKGEVTCDRGVGIMEKKFKHLKIKDMDNRNEVVNLSGWTKEKVVG